MKTKAIALLYLCLILIAGAIGAGAKEYKPEEVPNVQKLDRRQFVSDPDNILSEETKAKANSQLSALREKTTTEFVVVILNDIGDYEPAEFAHEILNEWGVGQSDKDNGGVLLIAIDQRKAFLATGYGLEGPLPDISTQKILQRAVVPAMKENDPDKAVTDAVTLISQVLTDPAVAEELKSADTSVGQPRLSKEEVARLRSLLWDIAYAMLIFAIAYFIIMLVRTRKLDNQKYYASWKQTFTILCVATVFSIGMALPVMLLALLRMKRARNRPIKCPNCGAKMHKLNEEEDNALLTPSQDFEEKLDSVDYDVWVCPQCNTVERYAFRVPESKYTECPYCHTVAMAPESDTVIRRATTREEGLGEKVSRCRYCGKELRRTYRIPRKDDGLAAAAILGAAASGLGRGGHGGGGSFGGGFGGGRSGGGGSGAGW